MEHPGLQNATTFSLELVDKMSGACRRHGRGQKRRKMIEEVSDEVIVSVKE
jgi:hypothetical protein